MLTRLQFFIHSLSIIAMLQISIALVQGFVFKDGATYSPGGRPKKTLSELLFITHSNAQHRSHKPTLTH